MYEYCFVEGRIYEKNTCLKTSQVEGLCYGNTGYYVIMDLFGNGSGSGVLLSVEDQVGMDLIGDQHYAIFHTDLSHLFQIFFIPYKS